MSVEKIEDNLYEIVIDHESVNFQPSNEFEEILQNVITICSTPKGSRALDRDFGINPIRVDEPFIGIQPRLVTEISEAVKKYEPRAQVVKVSVGADNLPNGRTKLAPLIRVKLNG